MKYITITSKHHDGFCMFDSKLTRYDIVDATPYGKDPLKALADACHKQGIKLFFYYSLLDWHHPDYFPRGRTGQAAGREEKGDWKPYVAYYQGQVRELCTNYGEIGGIWFDGWWDRPDADWDLDGTYRLIHELQPGALVGNNHHVARSPARTSRCSSRTCPARTRPGSTRRAWPRRPAAGDLPDDQQSWGYNARDTKFKSPEQADPRPASGAAGRGANLLLNVGPRPDGTIGAGIRRAAAGRGQVAGEATASRSTAPAAGPSPPSPGVSPPSRPRSRLASISTSSSRRRDHAARR